MATQPTASQIERNTRSAGMWTISIFLGFTIGVMEALAWYEFAGGDHMMQAVFIAIAVLQVIVRPYLIFSLDVAKADGDIMQISNINGLLIVSMIITIFSLGIFLYGHTQGLIEQAKRDSTPVKDAKVLMDKAQLDYDTLDKSLKFTSAELKNAVANQATYKQELKETNAQNSANLFANQSKINKASTEFFNRTHTNGVIYSDILDRHCVPKRSEYGLMTSSAKQLCPELKRLLAGYTVQKLDTSSIKMDIAETQEKVLLSTQLQNAYDAKEKTKHAYYTTLESAKGASNIIAIFTLISEETGIKRELIMLGFMLVVIFFLLKSWMVIESFKTKVQSVPVYKNGGEKKSGLFGSVKKIIEGTKTYETSGKSDKNQQSVPITAKVSTNSVPTDNGSTHATMDGIGFGATLNTPPIDTPNGIDPDLYQRAIALIKNKALDKPNTGNLTNALRCRRNDASKIMQDLKNNRPDLIDFSDNTYKYA